MPRQKPLTVLAIGLPLLMTLTLAACGGPEPKMMVATKKDDGVAANSASEERLAAEGKPKAAAPGPASDPSQPYTTPVGGGDTAAASAGAAAGGGGSAAGAPAGKGSGKKGDPKAPPTKSTTGKVSQAECKQLFDKYIDLTVGSDSRFEGIGADMIAQLKEQALAQAKQQKGDPCSTEEVSRTQYTCAMASTTTSAWQKCLK